MWPRSGPGGPVGLPGAPCRGGTSSHHVSSFSQVTLYLLAPCLAVGLTCGVSRARAGGCVAIPSALLFSRGNVTRWHGAGTLWCVQLQFCRYVQRADPLFPPLCPSGCPVFPCCCASGLVGCTNMFLLAFSFRFSHVHCSFWVFCLCVCLGRTRPSVGAAYWVFPEHPVARVAVAGPRRAAQR